MRYDVVTCMEVLEHVPDSGQTGTCLRADCSSRAVTHSSPPSTAMPKSFLFAIVGAEYVLRLLPRGTHEYAKLIKPSELASICRNAGITVVDIVGMTYNPFTQVYALGRDTDVNYILC